MIAKRFSSLRTSLKLSKAYEEWVRKARPILLEILQSRRKDFDGFEYSKSSPEAGYIFRLKLRDDGNFEVFDGDYKYDNEGKGFTPEDIVYEDFRYGILWKDQLSLAYDTHYVLKERRDLINAIKRITRLDFRKEIKKKRV